MNWQQLRARIDALRAGADQSRAEFDRRISDGTADAAKLAKLYSEIQAVEIARGRLETELRSALVVELDAAIGVAHRATGELSAPMNAAIAAAAKARADFDAAEGLDGVPAARLIDLYSQATLAREHADAIAAKWRIRREVWKQLESLRGKLDDDVELVSDTLAVMSTR